MAALDERSYRRGLILGLTMAEVMVLVLFALLLIWMVGLRVVAKAKSDNVRLSEHNENLVRQVSELQEQKRALLSGSSEGAFDELFRELKLTKEKLASADSQLKSKDSVADTLNGLGYSFNDEKSAAESARDLRERLRIAAAVLKLGRDKAKQSVTETEMRTKLAALVSIDDALTSQGRPLSSLPSECAAAMDRESQCSTRLTTLQGRLANAQKQLATVGRGTEKPACWADPGTGKPEYIFDIALKSSAVVVRDNGIPHRGVEQASLPLKSISFERDLKQQEFRFDTQALFEWSEKEGCRFFVRVFDLTAAHEKDAYKRQLRTVGEHFYYYEELNRPWESSVTDATH